MNLLPQLRTAGAGVCKNVDRMAPGSHTARSLSFRKLTEERRALAILYPGLRMLTLNSPRKLSAHIAVVLLCCVLASTWCATACSIGAAAFSSHFSKAGNSGHDCCQNHHAPSGESSSRPCPHHLTAAPIHSAVQRNEAKALAIAFAFPIPDAELATLALPGASWTASRKIPFPSNQTIPALRI